MLEIGREGQDLDEAAALVVGHLRLRRLDEIELDGLVQAVDHVVRLLDFLDELELAALDGRERGAQHGADMVAEAERLAHGAGERLGRRVEHARIEMARLAFVGLALRIVGGDFRQEARHDADQRQRDDGDRDVEEHVEQHDGETGAQGEVRQARRR